MARTDILFVLGAGVEKNLVQIDDKEYDGMPLAEDILLEIIKFERKDGKEIREILQDKLKQQRYKYISTYVKNSIQKINLETETLLDNPIKVMIEICEYLKKLELKEEESKKIEELEKKLNNLKYKVKDLEKMVSNEISEEASKKENRTSERLKDKITEIMEVIRGNEKNKENKNEENKDKDNIGFILNDMYKHSDNEIIKKSSELMLYLLLLVVLDIKIKIAQKELKIDEKLEKIFTNSKILSEDEIKDIFKIPTSSLSEPILKKIGKIIDDYVKYEKKDKYKDILEYSSKQILRSLFDFEELLAKEFLNLYTKNKSGIKRYLNWSWIIWAYFKNKELDIMKKLKENNTDGIFYKALAEAIELAKEDKNVDVDIKVITFNYTSFVDNSLKSLKENGRIIHFHGTLNEYIKLKDLTVEKINLIDNSIKKTLENILEENKDEDKGKNRDKNKNDENTLNKNNKNNKNEDKIIIPGFIPPLKLKPVLSKEFLDNWCMASNWIETAENIVVIGYSFSHSDEHFNDLIRKWYKKTKEERHKKLVLIGPSDEEKYAKRIENLLIPNSNKDSNLDINVLELGKSNEDTKNIEEKIVIIPNTPAEKLDKNKLKKLFDILTHSQK